MYISKKILVLVVAAALAVGSVASVAAQDNDAAQEHERHKPDDVRRDGRWIGHAGHMKGWGPAIRSQHVFAGRDGDPARTLRTDRGVVQSVEGDTFTMLQDDGTAVRVAVDADTSVIRDGAQAGGGELQEGDHVVAMRMREGDGELQTLRVHAQSAQRRTEADARRAEMRERFKERREEMQQRRAQRQQRWQERRGEMTS